MPPKLAVILSAPGPEDAALHRSVVSMVEALRCRGFRPDEIWTLVSNSRGLTRSFCEHVGEAVASWRRGDLFLHYVGHGAYCPTDATTASAASPAMKLDATAHGRPERWLMWDDVFSRLAVPASVHLTVLPDS